VRYFRWENAMVQGPRVSPFSSRLSTSPIVETLFWSTPATIVETPHIPPVQSHKSQRETFLISLLTQLLLPEHFVVITA
jgi:hypothetical protein